MRKKGFKGRCEKKPLSKSKEVCRTYDPIQNMYAEKLEESPDIQEIRCNVLLEGLEDFANHPNKCPNVKRTPEKTRVSLYNLLRR